MSSVCRLVVLPRLFAAIFTFAVVAPLLPAAARAATDCAVFVATTGVDAPGSGLASSSPCRTINFGIARAVSSGRSCVYVQGGSYSEIVALASGVSVTGGFDSQWQYSQSGVPPYQVVITGGLDTGGNGQYLTVRAHSLAAPVVLSDLTLVGPNATGSGRSAYVVHVRDANLTLQRVTLIAGNGADGAPGVTGADAITTSAAPSGASGANGGTNGALCDNTTLGAGGSAGTNSCLVSPSARAMNGGAGGAGGTEDTNCNILSLDFTATNGITGANAAFTLGAYGHGGAGGTGADACAGGQSGAPGLVTNGGGGGASTGVSVDALGNVTGRAGSSGSAGQNGSGGGGGGGAGGCDTGTDAWGAGGGGGGAGGCAALGGGSGGAGGGCSVGIMVVGASTVTVMNCQIQRGTGGDGGGGGAGGRGQSGGAGGQGGAGAPGHAAGGAGGAGAHGGHGGGGGGGQGGYSVGILTTPSATVTATTVTYLGGSAGLGGAGGASAPSAPLGERDGFAGTSGSPGVLDGLRQLGTNSGGEPAPIAVRATARPAKIEVACDPSACGLVAVPGEPPSLGNGELAFVSAAPNPAAAGMRFTFRLPAEGPAEIGIFDLRGARLRTLGARTFGAGEWSLTWDLRDDGGAPLRAGLYWARLAAGGRLFTRAVVVNH